ncbi:MAG TPA: hypothetical protein VIJ82_12210 [Streptosporangiaceae bacterium]|jgi:hypothetical protein
MRRRSAWALVVAPIMAVASVGMTAASQAATAAPARVTTTAARPQVKPHAVNNLDCNGYSNKYTALSPGGKMRCTDPLRLHRVKYDGKWVLRGYRFKDNGHYVGHDEPSVKFISHTAGSGNTMTYLTKLAIDPRRQPTANGSVTKYAELSVAPWFGLPMCDPASYPQNPCTPDSDTNSGAFNDPHAAGSAFMELQLYPPGFAPFADSVSCTRTQWCAALNIDSLESEFNFVNLNPACTEPINFAYLQRNGVPTGPPGPQLANTSTLLPNGQTLKMNSGDVLRVSISDPAAGFTTRITDLTTGQSGFMVASAQNGFMNTNYKTCAGMPHTFHAEYSTASQPNQVPWAALEGGVLMQQEIGHFESCSSVAHRLPVSLNGGTFTDKNVFQTCVGGSEGKRAVGEGPCNPKTGVCQHATTEGTTSPIACPSNNAGSGQLCEFSDGNCFQQGNRVVMVNGKARIEHAPIAACLQNSFQNGDLDFDGTPYQTGTWPNGSPNHPTSFRYIGPFDGTGHSYPQIQFETDAPGSEFLCNTTTGNNCVIKPLGSKFYPFWSINNTQRLAGVGTPAGACVWNFGNVLPGVTKNAFGRDAQYGSPHIEQYGGTTISAVMANPAVTGKCPAVSLG